MSLVKSWVWPDVSIRRKAQSVINEVFAAATVVAVLSSMFCVMPTSSESNSSGRPVGLRSIEQSFQAVRAVPPPAEESSHRS